MCVRPLLCMSKDYEIFQPWLSDMQAASRQGDVEKTPRIRAYRLWVPSSAMKPAQLVIDAKGRTSFAMVPGTIAIGSFWTKMNTRSVSVSALGAPT